MPEPEQLTLPIEHSTLLILDAKKKLNEELASLDFEVPTNDQGLVIGSIPTDIVPADISNWKVDQVIEQTDKFKINGINDTPGLSLVESSRKLKKKMRGVLKKWKDEAKEPHLFINKGIDKRFNELWNKLEASEERDEAKLLAHKRALDAIEADRASAEEERYQVRLRGFMDLGMHYDPIGKKLVLGEAEIPDSVLRLTDNETLTQIAKEKVMPAVMIFRTAQQQQKELQEKADELEKQVRNHRIEELRGMGMVPNLTTARLVYQDMTVSIEVLGSMSEADYEVTKNNVRLRQEKMVTHPAAEQRAVARSPFKAVEEGRVIGFAEESKVPARVWTKLINDTEGNTHQYGHDILELEKILTFYEPQNLTTETAKHAVKEIAPKLIWIGDLIRGTIKDLHKYKAQDDGQRAPAAK